VTDTAYIATVAAEVLEASDDLCDLMRLLSGVREPPPCKEDIAVWHGGVLIVVRHPDGSWTWVCPSYRRPSSAAVA
jgi:hypothetical protein